ncbi:MAG: DUF2179 domain-containing protein [Defluviitoga tunisiensis]|jgi:uncharacterized protein YebE (UPF0316 family)|uniref:UPF0316 protein DTL3_0084 n=1 Tax=Defluviitoga tunisiensis TaxID=1006576 RepID=A0A0C7NVE2_DEFTU|nr:DUF2179 domain-containing protein [Defluviitoga tunisiensis]MDY0380054.1 DUF2179 domain-containing protein [Defluviitoga tunisiensis]CEP77418.1 hypothetical protein DTL3_0084 [Defluviitoga tunisiensis]HHV00582.1 DUF2179 domain-containing protein [Defluviitoga tunisiensis]HOB55843.1 DUF2179 domain-containing protein [Defluviitoga tunisiensis]HOK16725.1 DUF2179 domain-containing protein [Defluviitoga tunisiensis]
MAAWMDSSIFNYVVLPFIIFLMRLTDVTLMTLRIIFVSKGYKLWSSVMGFFEVSVWLVAISQVMNNLDKPLYAIAYAVGFACGNYLGAYLDEKIALGVNLLQIITNKDAEQLVKYLRDNDFGVTSINAEGARGPVKVIYSVVRRKDLNKIIQIVNEFNPNAFYSVAEVRSVNKGIFPVKTPKDKKLGRFIKNGK